MRFLVCGILFAASGVEGMYKPMNLKEFSKFFFKDHRAYHDIYPVWELSRDRGPGAAERMLANLCSGFSALAIMDSEIFVLWSASLFPDLEYAPPPPVGVEDEDRPLGASFFENQVWMYCSEKEGVVINWMGLSPTAVAHFIKFGIGSRDPLVAEPVRNLWLGGPDGNQAELIHATIPSIRRATLTRVLELAKLGWHNSYGESGEALNRGQVEPIFEFVLTSLANDDAPPVVGEGPRPLPIDDGAAVVHAHHHIAAPRRLPGKIMGFMEFLEKAVYREEFFLGLKNGWEYIRTHRDQEELIVVVFESSIFNYDRLPVGSPGFQVAIHSLFYSPPSDPPTDQDNQMREWMGSIEELGLIFTRMGYLYYECVNFGKCNALRIWLKQSPVAVGELFARLNLENDDLTKLFNGIFPSRKGELWHVQDGLRNPYGVDLVQATDAAVHAMRGMEVPLRSDKDLIKVLRLMLKWKANTLIR